MQKKYLFIIIFFLTVFGSYVYASSNKLEKMGDLTQIALPITAIAATVYHEDGVGFKEFLYSYIVATGTTHLLKYTVHRKRPNGSEHSFPSGHTSAAFVAANFLELRYGNAYGVPAYAVAAFTGYSRVQVREHWWTDVLAGMAIGIGSSYLFTHKYSKNVTVSPYSSLENKETGIQVTTRFS